MDIRDIISEKKTPHWKHKSKKPAGKEPPAKGNTSPHPGRGKMVGSSATEPMQGRDIDEQFTTLKDLGDMEIQRIGKTKYVLSHEPDIFYHSKRDVAIEYAQHWADAHTEKFGDKETWDKQYKIGLAKAKQALGRLQETKEPEGGSARARNNSSLMSRKGGPMKDKKKAAKRGERKPKGRKPPKSGNTSPHPARGKLVGEDSQINEEMSSWTDAGLDSDIAKYVLKKYHFKHNPEWAEVKKPKASEVYQGDLFMLPNAVVFKHPESRSANSYYVRIEKDSDGQIKEDWTGKISEAFKGLRGSWKKITKNSWFSGTFRRTKGGMTGAETDAALDQDPLAGSSQNIYNYMNKTFMPRLQPKLDQYVDEIFAGLRKLPKDRDKYNQRFSPRNDSFFRNPASMREEAISYANVLEQLAEEGFTQRTMKNFLRHYGTLRTGFRSIPDNEKELSRLLKTEKLARQKLAKLILDEAKALKDQVDKLHWRASGGEEAERKLRGESLEESPVVTRVGHKLDGMVKELFKDFMAKDHDLDDIKQLMRAMGHHLEVEGERAVIHRLQRKWGVEEGLADMDEAHGNSKIYDKCWDGYEKVPGKKRGEKGSCRKKTTGKS